MCKTSQCFESLEDHSKRKQQDIFQQRLVSVDALRGFDMFWIIGGTQIFTSLIKATDNGFLAKLLPQFKHARWVGFTFMDLVMPLFLFVVGVVIPFSLHKRIESGDSKKKIYVHIIKRTIILFVLGIALQGRLFAYDLSKLHIFCNTLQAIAVGYCVASIVLLNFKLTWQVVITSALLLSYWALMVLVPFPECQPDRLLPEANLALYIDKLILGRFEDGTTYTWILSGLGFASTVLLGAMAGQLLRSDRTDVFKILSLLAMGSCFVLLGLLWHCWFPINKHIWSSSFVLFSAGLSCLLLTVFYLIIDVCKLRKWAFGFVVIGMNAIAIYTATMLFDFRRITNVFVGELAIRAGRWGDSIHASAAFVLIWLILYWMYRKKSFIKI